VALGSDTSGGWLRYLFNDDPTLSTWQPADLRFNNGTLFSIDYGVDFFYAAGQEPSGYAASILECESHESLPADVDCRVCCSQLPQALISGAGTVWRNSSSEWRSSDSSTCNSIVSVAYGNGVWLALCWQVRASTIDHDPHRAHVIACVPRAAIERSRKEAALGQQGCNAAL